VLILHVHRLNAELLDTILRLFEDRGYRFVTLGEAQNDAAFRTAASVTKFGPMWGYRLGTRSGREDRRQQGIGAAGMGAPVRNGLTRAVTFRRNLTSARAARFD